MENTNNNETIVTVDAPAVDAPAVDAPAVDAPAVDAPAVDAPAVDAPAVDAPASDAPASDAPASDASVNMAENGVAHIDAFTLVNSEMVDIASIRDAIKTRTGDVKAACVHLMLWYIACMPLHLDLVAAIAKGRTLAFAKCDIKATGKDKDVYGPVRGEFDGLRTRLIHSNIDPRLFKLPETVYETLPIETMLDKAPTVAGIRKAKKDAEKQDAVDKAVAAQAATQPDAGKDCTVEFLALQRDNNALRDEIATHVQTIADRDLAMAALNETIAALNADIERRAGLFKELETKFMNVVSVNATLNRRMGIIEATETLQDGAPVAPVDWVKEDKKKTRKGYRVKV